MSRGESDWAIGDQSTSRGESAPESTSRGETNPTNVLRESRGNQRPAGKAIGEAIARLLHFPNLAIEHKEMPLRLFRDIRQVFMGRAAPVTRINTGSLNG